MTAKSPRIRSNARSPQRSKSRSAIMLSGINGKSFGAMLRIPPSSSRLSMRPSNNMMKRSARTRGCCSKRSSGVSCCRQNTKAALPRTKLFCRSGPYGFNTFATRATSEGDTGAPSRFKIAAMPLTNVTPSSACFGEACRHCIQAIKGSLDGGKGLINQRCETNPATTRVRALTSFYEIDDPLWLLYRFSYLSFFCRTSFLEYLKVNGFIKQHLTTTEIHQRFRAFHPLAICIEQGTDGCQAGLKVE